MTTGDIIIGTIVLIVVFLAGYQIFKPKKKGGGICGGDCSGCPGRSGCCGNKDDHNQ